MSFLGVYSTAAGADAVLLDGDGGVVSSHSVKAKESVVETVREALAPFESQQFTACLSLRALENELPGELIPKKSYLCKPQEALLAGALGGRPGVVIQSASAFRAMAVDDEGRLKGLAQDAASCPWFVQRSNQMLRLQLDDGPVEDFPDFCQRVGNSQVLSGVLLEARHAACELLLHLLPRLLFREEARITAVGPGFDSGLLPLIQEELSRYVRGLTWVEPVGGGAMGAALLARAANSIDTSRIVDATVWKRLFSR